MKHNKATKEPHVPGAYLALPTPPKVATIWDGFFKLGNLLIENACIH